MAPLTLGRWCSVNSLELMTRCVSALGQAGSIFYVEEASAQWHDPRTSPLRTTDKSGSLRTSAEFGAPLWGCRGAAPRGSPCRGPTPPGRAACLALPGTASWAAATKTGPPGCLHPTLLKSLTHRGCVGQGFRLLCLPLPVCHIHQWPFGVLVTQ